MERMRLIFAGVAAAAPAVPAPAVVLIAMGVGPARSCYKAALTMRAQRGPIAVCDDAVEAGRTRDERVAGLINRGIIKHRIGLTDAAIADFDRAIALDPAQAEAWLNRGLVAIHDEALGVAAVPYFDAALERGTRRPALAYFGRAQAQEMRGNVSAAYYDYRRVAELDPAWALPQRELERFKVVRRRPGAGVRTQRG